MEEERRGLEASPLSLSALSRGKAGSGLTVMSETVLSVLALYREFGSLVVIVTDVTVALPSLSREATEPCPRFGNY